MARLALIAFLAAAGAAGPLDSCYGYNDHLVLMPDKSGKIEFVTSEKTSESSLDKAKAGIFKLSEDTGGFAAFTMPTYELKDGWAIVRCTVYFEDINLLNYIKGRKHTGEKIAVTPHDECLHFALITRPNDKTYFILHIEDWLFSELPGATGERKWEEMKKDSENIVIRRVTVPGKVQWRDGFRDFQSLDGRTVTLERSPKTIKRVQDALEFPVAGARRVEFVGNEVTDAELAAFRKELEAAKAAWPKVKEELQAAARKLEKK